MEHSALADPVLASATENLISTYLELGRATRGAHAWREEGFHVCTGRMDHPICNFAADIQFCDSVAQRLRAIAERKRSFAVYTFPPHTSERLTECLLDEGFTYSHQLAIMASAKALDDPVDLALAETRPDRLKVAEFMAEQFFHRQPTGFRRGIAEATANADSLKLYRALWNQQTAAAVMISEQAGIFGLYNLCVAPQFRGRGWGSAIVRTIVGQAQKSGQSVTLQCEPSLGSWYSSLGFEEVGSVSVFGLYRIREIDIMS